MNLPKNGDWNWQLPTDWTAITTIDMHTGGEPLRVITGGLPAIVGSTVLEKRRYFREHYDSLRTGLLLEPRGHADMYGAVISASKDADFDVSSCTTKAIARCAVMPSLPLPSSQSNPIGYRGRTSPSASRRGGCDRHDRGRSSRFRPLS